MKCIKRPHSVWTACNCPPCLRANARLAKSVRTGTYSRVSPEMGWQVLERLIAAGWSPKAIGSATGTGWHRWHSILRTYSAEGVRRRLSPHSCTVLLKLGDPTEGQVGSYAASRRLRALARIGWGLDQLADKTGIGFSTLAEIRKRDEGARVGVDFYRRILAVYEELHMTPGPASQAITQAEQKGWPPPLAWLDIDDPAEVPDSGYRPMKNWPAAELLGEWDHLRQAGVSDHQAALQLGLTLDALERAALRHRQAGAA